MKNIDLVMSGNLSLDRQTDRRFIFRTFNCMERGDRYLISGYPRY